MKRKTLLLFLATITATALLFTGCGNKETETTPVSEEAIEEVEATEQEEIEPVEEDNLDETNEVEGDSVGASIIVDGEIVEGTALTQAEIDELKSNAPTDDAKENVKSDRQKWDIIAELDGFTPKSEAQIEQMGLTGTELESFIRTYWEKGMDMLAEMEVEELQSIRDQLVKAYEDNF